MSRPRTRVAKTLHEHVIDYLALRRALGFKLERVGLLLDQFVDYLDELDTFTIADAVTWATLPAGGSPAWHASRLSAVRGFALYLHALDPTVEVPAADVVPGRTRRATPFLYSDSDIAALITAAATLRSPLRVVTYQSVVGLLAVTGLRVGEVIRLARGDAEAPDARGRAETEGPTRRVWNRERGLAGSRRETRILEGTHPQVGDTLRCLA